MNSNFVNADNSHYSGNFSSNVIPGLPGLAGAKLNVDAARSYVPGISMNGGNKLLKKNINKITKRYKMSATKLKSKKRKLKRHLNKTRSIRRTNHRHKIKTRRNKKMKGGMSAFTPSYTTGNVILSSSNMALANPPPTVPFSDCRDNYNHFKSS